MKFVLVHSFANYIDANIALGRLEEEGIRGWLRDEHTVTIDPILTNAVGGIKLMVPETQAERALELLQQFREQRRQLHPCPNCASTNTELVSTPRKASNWLSALASFFLGDFAIASNKVYHCFQCGHEFKEEEEE